MYNGWTPTIPLKTQVQNLIDQIPQEYRARASAECMDENPFDFARKLTGYVMHRTWETYASPIDEAEFPQYTTDDDYADLKATQENARY